MLGLVIISYVMITEVEDGTGCNYPHGCTVGVLNSFISHEKLVSFKNPWIWEQMFCFILQVIILDLRLLTYTPYM